MASDSCLFQQEIIWGAYPSISGKGMQRLNVCRLEPVLNGFLRLAVMESCTAYWRKVMIAREHSMSELCNLKSLLTSFPG